MPHKEPAKRTGSQNRALHQYFTMLAEELNNAGYNVQLVLKETVEIDWTPRIVKEVLWRRTQSIILDKTSTTELNKQEDITRVYEHLNRHISAKFGIHVPFPSLELGAHDRAPMHKDETHYQNNQRL